MWTIGDTAVHRNSRESFGKCEILEINATTALVGGGVRGLSGTLDARGELPLRSGSHMSI